MIITVPPNTTLLRLVINNPDKFYKQDWYYDEEFANELLVNGIPDNDWIFNFETTLLYPAALWVFLHTTMYGGSILKDRYVWTSDRDHQGDHVYVGNWGAKGFQIHRHLTIRPEMFINTLD